jgi:hypothetical protein
MCSLKIPELSPSNITHHQEIPMNAKHHLIQFLKERYSYNIKQYFAWYYTKLQNKVTIQLSSEKFILRRCDNTTMTKREWWKIYLWTVFLQQSRSLPHSMPILLLLQNGLLYTSVSPIRWWATATQYMHIIFSYRCCSVADKLSEWLADTWKN